MPENIDISVVIPAYNEEKILPKNLESLNNQETLLNYEVIVVNNNSSDKTKKIAEEYGAIVIYEERQGVGWARSTGTAYARGIIIVHIDADTVVPKNYLEKIKDHFKNDEDLVCLGGQFYFYDAPKWKNILRTLFYKPTCYFAKLCSWGKLGPTGGNMAFRKSAYNKTSGFNAHLKFGEDGDLTIKLGSLGKVKVDMNLKCGISSRRYNFDKDFFLYVLNFFSLCFRGKPYKNKLSSHDKE